MSLLDGSLPAIRAEDLRVQAEDLRDQFGPQALPLDPQVMAKFSREEAEVYRGRTFVTQLLWIALDENRLLKAIRDYHRAYTQRSEWLRRGYLCEAEIDRFAFALHDEWEQVFDRRVAQAERSGGASPEDTGMAIFEEICANSRARIRERFDQGWLNRGTLHQLAEGFAELTIGWHPDFASKLESLLRPVVAEEPVQ
ncbi:ABC-three component system protein [Micromonospora sp. CV4]|uniref:ABC-three component system protein n=1 Tax=Micromonospora sp. CV4 TaxID=2478711 RepID=UPI0011C3FCBC|nr:ABC-three component system protein [Micromonospora sp. CV4]